MTFAPISLVRSAPAGRGILAAPRGATAPQNDQDSTGQQQIAAQHHAFDLAAAERAETERENEALQALLMAWLKNEDEIMKKWIALI